MISQIPPSGALFASFLGINPMNSLPSLVISSLPKNVEQILMSPKFFPSSLGLSLITGLRDSLYIAILLTLVGAVLSALRGRKYVHEDAETTR